MKNLSFLIAITLIFGACSAKVWEKTSDGVVVHPQNKSENSAQTIKLQVINDQIIRVVASPTEQINSAKSLCVVDNPGGPTSFEVTEQADTLVLTTAKATAKVSMQTGAVVFYDENGKVILKERASGGKTFAPNYR